MADETMTDEQILEGVEHKSFVATSDRTAASLSASGVAADVYKRQRYRRLKGHRQQLTKLKIVKVQATSRAKKAVKIGRAHV